MKKLGLLFVTVIMLMLFAVSASAETKGYYIYEVENDEATITDVYTSISGNVTIPSTLGGYSVTSIGDNAFEDCKKITSIIIPDSVTSISYCAFMDCEGLTSVTIGKGVTSIGYLAFSMCRNLTSITIPESVTYISTEAFSLCSKLTRINVDENNKYYSNDSNGVLFNKDKTELVTCPPGITSATYIIPDSVTSIGYYAFGGCEGLKSITIPDSVTSISGYAFSHCWVLTSITIPDSVMSIGHNAFGSCGKLTSINVDENNKNYSSDSNGVLFNKDKTELIKYPEGNKSTTYIIPDSVTSIGYDAFAWCNYLENITVPGSVTSINDYAFYNSNILSIIISEGVTSIGNHAFSACHNPLSVTIPVSVTTIGDMYFSLEKDPVIYYAGTAQQWKEITIDGDKNGIKKTRIHFSSTQESHPYLPTNTIAPTCNKDGYTIYSCGCGYTYESDRVWSTGHKFDSNKVCEKCGYVDCSCNCHKTGFMGFIWKITRFFNKLFKTNKTCACGVVHY